MNRNSRQKEAPSQALFPRPSIPPLRRTTRRLPAKIPSRGTKFCPQATSLLLHETFLIGNDGPADIGTMLQNADKLLASCSHAACLLHNDALYDHGWRDEDTTALGTAIDLLDGGDTEQEAAKDQKKGFTKARNLAADALYKMCLSVQNAARLAHPTAKAAKDEATLVARNRFLLDEFPPRDREKAEATTPPPTPPAA